MKMLVSTFVCIILVPSTIAPPLDEELFNAVVNGNVDLVKKLLKNKEVKNPFIYSQDGAKYTVLHTAALAGKVNIIKHYKEELNFRDINPYDSENNFTPMLLAAESGNKNIVEYYIKTENKDVWNRASKSNDIFNQGLTPLHVASRNGRDNIVKILLEQVTEKRPKNAVGRTPLHYSAWKGHVDTTKMLIEAINDNTLINEVNMVLQFYIVILLKVKPTI